jgi:catechol-2,3-dioxygenase
MANNSGTHTTSEDQIKNIESSITQLVNDQKGLEELVTYLWIASNREHHFVDMNSKEEYTLSKNEEETVTIKFPKVVYKI